MAAKHSILIIESELWFFLLYWLFGTRLVEKVILLKIVYAFERFIQKD
jgi:hypothetical protein